MMMMGRREWWLSRVLLALVIAVSLVNTRGGIARAAVSTDEGDEGHHPVTYVATALLDVLYVPAKVIVGSLGAVTSGLAYVVTVGDPEAFNSVWDSAVKGDYVVTPRMIEGKDPVHFAGAEAPQ